MATKDSLSPTTRFSTKSDDYIRFRPSYPPELVSELAEHYGLSRDSVIADIGSGTGKLTELFLDFGCTVYGVEPNVEMRGAGEQYLKGYRNFTSVDGTAEDTTLSDHSVDFITAGQAYHWFDPEQTRREFKRILRPSGWVALVWNDRQAHGTPFLDAYEVLLNSLPEYRQVGHRATTSMGFENFFGAKPELWSKPTSQAFDWEGLLGRAVSSSYVPSIGTDGYGDFKAKLRHIFQETSDHGQVEFLYETKMFLGRLDK